jgi:hypothetical protein
LAPEKYERIILPQSTWAIRGRGYREAQVAMIKEADPPGFYGERASRFPHMKADVPW